MPRWRYDADGDLLVDEESSSVGGYGGLHAVVLAGHSSALRWGKAAELHFGFPLDGVGTVFGWLPMQAGCQITMFLATSASWLPDHHVSELAARSRCFWLPVQAGCQIIMFLATSASWLPGHDVSGYQCKLTARSSCFWLPVQAGCQVTMFLATSASWLPGHDVSGYQCKLPREGGCGVVGVLWLVFGSTVAKVAEAWKKTNQSFRDWGRVRCSMWWNS